MGVVILVLIAAGLYFTPTIVAAIRKVPNVGSVIVINLLLGWTLVGWTIALAMACRSAAPVQQVVVQAFQPSVGSASQAQLATTGGRPAAWYPDPWGQARERYWDGSNWTGHLNGTLLAPPSAARR